MTDKINFGRVCEDFVAEIISLKTKFNVENLNDIKKNHPITDLKITNSEDGSSFEVSVKAKKSQVWPAVKGILKNNQYIIFVDIYSNQSPDFYILNNRQWQGVLKKILPNREEGAEILKGAIEWNWTENGKQKKYRGSQLLVEDISKYKDCWGSIPGITV